MLKVQALKRLLIGTAVAAGVPVALVWATPQLGVGVGTRWPGHVQVVQG
jgi:hypothetical protein